MDNNEGAGPHINMIKATPDREKDTLTPASIPLLATRGSQPSMDLASCFTEPAQVLHASVRDRDVARLGSLVAANQALVNSPSAWGTPLEVAVRCENAAAAQILLEAGAHPLRDDGDGDVYTTAMGLAAVNGLRDILKLFLAWLEPHLQQGEYQQQIEACLCAAAACGSGAVVYDFLAWTFVSWRPAALEAAWLAATGKWQADVVDMLFPLVPKDKATVERALRRAVGFKPILPAEERTGVTYEPADYLKQYRVVLRLLFAGAGANGLEHGDSGRPLLHMAASAVVLQGGLRALLDGGADPDIRQARGRTALHLLTSPVPVRGRGPQAEVHEAGIRLLLDKGASAMAADDEGEAGLHWAAMNCTADVFRLYLLSCPDRNAALAALNAHGETLLHYAAAGGQHEIVASLLDSGLDVHAVSHTGWTPLLCALAPTLVGGRRKTQRDALRTARLLLAHGATPPAATAEGWTALHCVGSYADGDAASDAADLARELLAHGGAPARDGRARAFDRLWLARVSGATRAALYGDEPWGFRVGQTLARCAGAEKTAVARDGLTPLHWAAERGSVAVAAVLLEAGADMALPDSTGATPRRLAAKSTLLEHEPQIKAALERLFAKQGA